MTSIEIIDSDLPIQVASKLISAQTMRKDLFRRMEYCEDMFSKNELQEIAYYLLIYCEMGEQDG